MLEALGRGDRIKIGTFADKPLSEVVCINCGQCINRCPTGALRANDPTDEVWAAIDDPRKHVVIQTAPSPRAAIGECFGLPPGTAVTFQLNTALRRCGFDKVFDTNFAADLTIVEEGAELLVRLKQALADGQPSPLPQFTSCSPGWVKFLEHFYPESLPHLSTAKSPQQMFGALLKTWYCQVNGLDPADVVTVALMATAATTCSTPPTRHGGSTSNKTTRQTGPADGEGRGVSVRMAGVPIAKENGPPPPPPGPPRPLWRRTMGVAV